MGFFGGDDSAATATAERPLTAAERYDRHRRKAGERRRKESAAGRELYPLPAVKNPERRARALADLEFFLSTYFPERFFLKWSAEHRTAIADLQRVILEGGKKCLAMPRGSGKTAIAECAALWAIFRGSRRFALLVCATADMAKKILKKILTILNSNPLLMEDFPEIVAPIKALNGTNQRKPLYQGERVAMTFTKETIVFPEIPGSLAASAIIQTFGLTGSIRGSTHERPDGSVARPDFAMVDDPQNDKSAKSPTQCETRLELINGAVLGSAGPTERIAAVALVTVIKRGDLADRLLDPKESPEWQGQRTKMVYAFPTNLKLWIEYGQVRADGFRRKDGGAAGNAFYLQHREEMDAGCVLGWPERVVQGDVSGVQTALNIWLEKPKVFAAEYQNEPLDESQKSDLVTAEQIRNKLSRIARGIVPAWVEVLTAHIDVQMNALYWLVAGWANGFTGTVIDYGCFPDQETDYFAHADIKHKLSEAFEESMGLEGRIYAGLEQVVAKIGGREWPGELPGTSHRLRRILIDSGWQKKTVFRFCRQSPHAPILMPSKGKGITAVMKPMDEWKVPAPNRIGQDCVIYVPTVQNPARWVLFDSNAWKSFCQHRFSTAAGDRGAITLFGSNDRTHRMLADHLTSETRKDPKFEGRKVDQWQKIPGRDNHFLDNFVGSAVAASIEGVSVVPREQQPKPKKKRRASVWYPDHQE